MRSVLHDLLLIIFPATCCHCGTLLVGSERHLCTHCLSNIAWASSAAHPNNESEQRLSGIIPIQAAATLLFFKKGSVAQTIIHQIKYHGNTQMAKQYGHLLGQEICSSGRFSDIDYIIPVPLHWWRKMRRGYNQSELLCQAISDITHTPVISRNLYRRRYTQSQTHRGRIGRFQNMRNVFDVRNPHQLEGKHILLVDDILTTGATTESCYRVLSSIPGLRISVATLAIASH